MSGETDLLALLQTMRPELHDQPFVFCSIERVAYKRLDILPMGLFCEQEGVTLILHQHEADRLHLSYEATWACITLAVHSALNAVGLWLPSLHSLRPRESVLTRLQGTTTTICLCPGLHAC